MECMHNLAYAIALTALLIALPTNVVADDVAPEPEQGPPCDWFMYTLSPPDVRIDVKCLIGTTQSPENP